MKDFDLVLTVLAATLAPIALGIAAGFSFWRRRRNILGNVAASAVVGVVIVFLIARTFGMFFSCSVAEDPSCGTQASLDYATRILIGLAVVGWVDVFVLMVIGGVIDDRARKRAVRMDDL
jgi:uncharacterized membrane protein